MPGNIGIRVMVAIRWLVMIGTCLPLWVGAADAKPNEKSAVMAAYRQRLDFVRKQIPQVTRAAEAVAKRWVEKKQVPIPFPPGKMAPVSGIYICLLYRMLDEKIAGKLAAAAP